MFVYVINNLRKLPFCFYYIIPKDASPESQTSLVATSTRDGRAISPSTGSSEMINFTST